MDLKTNFPIAVTGASGFIGRHLLGVLKKEGFKTRALIHSKKSVQADEVVRGDLVKNKSLDKFLDKVEIVVNLVGSFYPPFEEQLETNVLALNNLCEVSLKNKVKRIIHISGSAAYGSAQEDKLFREDDPLKPDTLYGLAKAMSEDVARYYYGNHGLSFVIFRPPNVYGPGSDHGVVYNFIKSIKETGRVTVYGDGKQERDFLYIDDLVDAIIKSINYRGGYDVFNIGSGKTSTILDLASQLRKTIRRKVLINYKKEKDINVRVLVADISKIKRVLNWHPTVPLESGLQQTIGGT